MIFDGIDNLFKIKPTSGSFKHRATPLVPVLHQLRIQSHRFKRVKPSISGDDAVDLTHAVQFPKPNHQLPYHGVESGAESTAGDDGDANHGRVEEDLLPRPCAVVGEVGRRRGEDTGEVVGDLAEDDIAGGDVEAVGGAVELVPVQGIWEGFEVGEVVGEVGEPLDFNRGDGDFAYGGGALVVAGCHGWCWTTGVEVEEHMILRTREVVAWAHVAVCGAMFAAFLTRSRTGPWPMMWKFSCASLGSVPSDRAILVAGQGYWV